MKIVKVEDHSTDVKRCLRAWPEDRGQRRTKENNRKKLMRRDDGFENRKGGRREVQEREGEQGKGEERIKIKRAREREEEEGRGGLDT